MRNEMKKTTLTLLALLTLTSPLAYSEEADSEKLEAPKSYVINLLIQCKDYAVEDEVSKEDMNKYLLTCINDELEMSDYKLITALPKEG
jgi:hypothetical protein